MWMLLAPSLALATPDASELRVGPVFGTTTTTIGGGLRMVQPLRDGKSVQADVLIDAAAHPLVARQRDLEVPVSVLTAASIATAGSVYGTFGVALDPLARHYANETQAPPRRWRTDHEIVNALVASGAWIASTTRLKAAMGARYGAVSVEAAVWPGVALPAYAIDRRVDWHGWLRPGVWFSATL